MLMEAKHREILVSMDQIHPWDQFETIMIKWRKIVDNVNVVMHSSF
jgi:hypothetical protein